METYSNGLDLRVWIDHIKQLGLLKEVKGAEVDLEIGVVTELNPKRRKYCLLFDEIKGYQKGFRVLTGSLLDAKRVAYTFGFPENVNNGQLAKLFREKTAQANMPSGIIPPRYVSDAAFYQNVKKGQDVNMKIFPSPKWHEHDGGRYIGTADCVVTKDPETGDVHAGVYRAMVLGENELGIYLDTGHSANIDSKKYWKLGKPCPVVMTFGNHPLIFAVAGLDVTMNKFTYAGSLMGKPYTLVNGPITGLPIPSDSEIVVEGHILDSRHEEGPFGEFMGYYASGVTSSPVVRVDAIYYRNDPIILGTAPGVPPYDYSYYRCPMRAAVLWDILEKAGIRSVNGVWCHEEGASRALTVISLHQDYAGHARQAGYVACQSRAGSVGGKYVVVVDDDIDPTNLREVVWAICTRTDPATTNDVIRGTQATLLDPMTERTPETRIEEGTNSRQIIIACRPFSRLIRG
ncbi:MAG: UbiD family decarboxylase, partial [Rhabdochlamydiaceae bacterium]